MNAFLVFLKKEFLGGLRSKKLLIYLILFALIGMLSPFTAKIMPDLMASMMPESIEITIADPTSIDAWLQFYSNIGTIGLLIFVILFTDTLSAEINQGTFIQLITRGLTENDDRLSQSLLFNDSLVFELPHKCQCQCFLYDDLFR